MAKTDNANLPAKLALRRHFLRKYHPDGTARVLDCCQGSAVIWTTLQREIKLANYWGLDEKPKSGRLKIDSARVLSQPGWRYDVIDIDTYGLPWKHYAGVIKNGRPPMTVFLTIGANVDRRWWHVERARSRSARRPAGSGQEAQYEIAPLGTR